MNDQQHSSADALTDASALALYEKASIAASEFDSVEAAHVAFVRSILSSFPVEQPAAEAAFSAGTCFCAGVAAAHGGSCVYVNGAPKCRQQPAAAPIEKPVAWRWREKIDERWRFTRHDPSQLVRRPKFIEPLYLNAQAAAAPAEEMIRFCPECGRLGDIPAGYEACCPDWSQARIVPKRFAELCAETFRLCVTQPFPQSAASPAAAIPARSPGVWPTDAMNQAGLRALAEFHHTRGDAVDAVFLAMCAAAPQPAQADTIQCQAHSGPDCTECGGTGIWPAQADAPAEARDDPISTEQLRREILKLRDGQDEPMEYPVNADRKAGWKAACDAMLEELCVSAPADAAEAGDVPECNGSHDAGQIAAGDKECTACGE